MTRQHGYEGMNNRNDSSQSPEASHEQHQDFDDNANDLWSLYGKKVKSHDEAQVKGLKDDMDGVLIFVCACFFWPTRSDVNLIPGWLIIWCPHCVRRAKDSRFESQSRRPVGLLSESSDPHAQSYIATARRAARSQLYSLIALPDLSCIGV
jgi:hypothetical protein